jgi:hypothetical protein
LRSRFIFFSVLFASAVAACATGDSSQDGDPGLDGGVPPSATTEGGPVSDGTIGDDGSVELPDGGPTAFDAGSTTTTEGGDDASMTGSDGASDDATVDAPIDAPVDAAKDAPVDAPIDAPIDAPSCGPAAGSYTQTC